MQSLIVDLGDRSYPIHIGSNVLSNNKLLEEYIHGKQVCVVSNDVVGPLYGHAVYQSLSDYEVSYLELPDGEQHKQLSTVEMIFDHLLEHRHNRTTTIIAVGGGVLGDMAGFAAACYQRGVNFIQIPTTLLSQVDSSVGGKTGVNHPLGKNMIGAFYQPQAVLIDTSVLNTLPEREVAAGMAEVVKYGFIWDERFLTWIAENTADLMALDSSALSKAIYRSCEIKAQVVAQDEREGSIRAILNLGHTFGHAIETHQGYGNWLHGEAVAAGTALALKLSRSLGYISTQYMDDGIALLAKLGLPVQPPEDMTANDFLELMSLDKKVIDGRLRLILPTKPGASEIFSDVSASQITDLFHS